MANLNKHIAENSIVVKKITYSNGTYEGETKNGKEHGKGKLIWADGNSYDGDFRDGKCHGKGKLIWANGDSYDGEWENDKRHGFAVKTIKGKRTNEFWQNNKFVKII